MLAKTLKWGNSLALRIPKPLARECGIEENTPVDIHVENHELIVMPVRKQYSLEELLAGVTQENIHSEVSTGCPIGKELLYPHPSQYLLESQGAAYHNPGKSQRQSRDL